jgi:PAS domain S-box-containing protein
MAKISRKSLQWQSATNTFTSIILAGVLAVSLSAYLLYEKIIALNIPQGDLISYHGIALVTLVVLSLLFSTRSYLELSKPLDNLEQITHAMQMLSSKKYDEAKTIFNQIADGSKHQEINQLHFATLQLTTLLEKLDADVIQRNQSVQTKNKELQLERDFIKSLLDTAQLIILTMNEKAEITLFNNYGEQITGYKEADVLNSTVARMFPAGNWTEAQILFNELMADKIAVAQQDAELIDSQGHIKQISWLHSRIENPRQNATILSVGLDMTEKKRSRETGCMACRTRSSHRFM